MMMEGPDGTTKLRAGDADPHEQQTLYRDDGVGRAAGGPSAAAIG